MEETISTIMMKEHSMLNAVLGSFERNLEINKERAKENFDKFKWNLEKHFFVEEKAIFDVSGNLESEEISDIFDLMQEHSKIMIELKDIEKNLNSGKTVDVTAFKKNLLEHAKFEDEIFYPKLDEKLSLEKRKEIVSRAKEIIR
jgi:hemerythrin superfamily protein